MSFRMRYADLAFQPVVAHKLSLFQTRVDQGLTASSGLPSANSGSGPNVSFTQEGKLAAPASQVVDLRHITTDRLQLPQIRNAQFLSTNADGVLTSSEHVPRCTASFRARSLFSGSVGLQTVFEQGAVAVGPLFAKVDASGFVDVPKGAYVFHYQCTCKVLARASADVAVYSLNSGRDEWSASVFQNDSDEAKMHTFTGVRISQQPDGDAVSLVLSQVEPGAVNAQMFVDEL